MANVPGHLRLVSGTAIRGPYKRKHLLGTQRKEIEGLSYRDTYRTQVHEMYDFVGAIPSQQVSAPFLSGAGANSIATTGTSVANVVAPVNGFVSAVSYGSQTAFTQNGTNFFTFTSNDVRTSSTVLSVVTHANSTDGNALAINGGTNLVANTNYALALSAAATRYVKAGDVITFTATVTGTLAGAQQAPMIYVTFQSALAGAAGSTELSVAVTAAAGQPIAQTVANTANGEFLMQLSSTSEAETVALTFGDQLVLAKPDVAAPVFGNGPFFEARIKVGGNAAVGANDKVIFGVGTAFNTTFTSISKYALFELNGNMNLVLESKDGTTTNTDIVPSIGTTALTAGTYYYFTIDMSDPTNVLFWYDDGKVDIPLGGLNMGALAATDFLQPIIAVQRASGTDAVDVTVDVMSLRWDRY